MPERANVRSRLAALLVGHWSFFNGEPMDGTPSTHLLAQEIGDELYRTAVGGDLQRALQVARAMHAARCRAPETQRESLQGGECCGHCLYAALLDLSNWNMGLDPEGKHGHGVREADEHELHQARRQAEALEQRAGYWTPPRIPRDPRPGPPVWTAGLARELELHRHAQRSGAVLVISGPDHPDVDVRFARGSRPDRQRLIEGLQRGILKAQSEIDRLLRTGQDGWEDSLLAQRERAQAAKEKAGA